MEYLNTPEIAPGSAQPMPEPRRAGVELLPTGMTERFYLERFNVLSVFKEEGKVWTGWTGYQAFRDVYLESKRVSTLIYRRP
jgi:hypothetical protein